MNIANNSGNILSVLDNFTLDNPDAAGCGEFPQA